MSCEKERMFLEVDSDLFEAYNSAPESKRKTLQILLKSWLKEADISIDHELQLQLGDLEEDMTRTLSRIGNRFGELLNKFLSISDYGSDEKNKHSARVQLLKQIPLFTELSSFDLGLIAEQMEEFLVSADKELLVQGEKANAVFFLEEGSVAIIVNNELVAHLGEGDCFGEMSCLRNESTASATVRTVTACVVLRIPREKFLETVSRAPQLWRNLFLQATNRVKHINKRLSEVMHHTPQGLAKLDSEGRFTNEFSIQCLQFFGEKKLVGKQFSKLVFPALLEQQSDWNQLYQVLFSNTKVSFKAVARMLPSELKYKHQEEREKVFNLKYYPCYDPDENLTAVDIGIEDVTDARKFSEMTKALEAEKASIHKIYENPDLYMALINLIEEAITQLDTVEVSLKNQTISSDQVIEAKRLLHSIKGNSGLFKLDDLRDVSHSLEESLDAQLINRPEETEYYIQTFYERKPLLTKQLHYVNCLMDNIGEELRKRLLGVVFTTEEYQTLKDTVFEKSNQEIQQFIIDMEKVPVWNLVRGWKEEAEQLSGVLGKKVRFRIEGENIRIPNVLFRCLHTPLIHLLRNAVDHGLETPLGRKATGKNEVGLIRIKSSKTEDGQLEIAISDDGYGLDLSRIVEKARKNKKIDQNFVDESIANQEAWRIIFLPDFSTADEVTEVSGRGVGLSAIQKTIDELNGKIHVTSALSKGTTLSLRIPLDGVNFSQISKNDLN